MPSRHLLLAAALLALGLGACGRRGALDPPPGGPAVAAAPAGSPRSDVARRTTVQPSSTALATNPTAAVLDSPDSDVEEDDTGFVVSPQPNPRRRGRAYLVPTGPFILDPLL